MKKSFYALACKIRVVVRSLALGAAAYPLEGREIFCNRRVGISSVAGR